MKAALGFREYVCANMCDGDEGGRITMSVKVLLDDMQDFYEDYRMTYDRGAIIEDQVNTAGTAASGNGSTPEDSAGQVTESY